MTGGASSLGHQATLLVITTGGRDQVRFRAVPKGRPWCGATTQEPASGLGERFGLRVLVQKHCTPKNAAR
eukprot:scaffold84480_cov36-Phaeocystis_antarctica.AAC.3